MSLGDYLLMVGCKTSDLSGRAWKWDGTTRTEIGSFAAGGGALYTYLTDCIVPSFDPTKLYAVGIAYDGATGHTGIIRTWDGSSWAIDTHDTNADHDFFAVEEFQGKLYILFRNGTSYSVARRDGPGSLTTVTTGIGDSAAGSSPGWIKKIVGSGGAEILVAAAGASYSTTDRFKFSTDGTNWTANGSTFATTWCMHALLFWDDDNSRFMAEFTTKVNDYSAAAIGDAWASTGVAHGHPATSPILYGDHWKDGSLNVHVAPYAGRHIRTWNGAAWANTTELHATRTIQMSATSKSSWARWHGEEYLACTMSGYLSLFKSVGGVWTIPAVTTLSGYEVRGLTASECGVDRRRFSMLARACGFCR